MNDTTIELTEASLALLLAFVRDSGNWSNMPLLDITKEQRGNLSDLKRKGLLTTCRDEGCEFVSFEFANGTRVTDGKTTYVLRTHESGYKSTAEVA